MQIYDPTTHLRLHAQRAATATTNAEHRPSRRASARPRRRLRRALAARWSTGDHGGSPAERAGTRRAAETADAQPDRWPLDVGTTTPAFDGPRVLDPAAFRLLHRINVETDDATTTTPLLRAAVGVLIGASVPPQDVDRLLPRPGEPPVLVAALASWAIRHADDAAITIASMLLDHDLMMSDGQREPGADGWTADDDVHALRVARDDEFDGAYRRLVAHRFQYEDLRGDPGHVPALAAARADLDTARREIADLRSLRTV